MGDNWVVLKRIVDGKKLEDISFYKELPSDMEVLSIYISNPPFNGRVTTTINNNTVIQIVTTNN